MIRKVISYKTIRLLNIAELVIVFKRKLHIDEIKQLNNCSTKTAYDDIYHLMDWEDNRLEIEFRNKECFSRSRSIGDLIEYKQELLQNESLIKLLLNVYFKPELSIVDHAVELNYSEAHTRTQIIKLNEFLENFDFQIIYDKNKNSYQIQSDCQYRLALFIVELLRLSNMQYVTGSASKKDIVIQRLDMALKSSLFVTHYNLLDEIFECEQLSFQEFYQRCDISLLQSELSEEILFLKELGIEISDVSKAYLLDIFVIIYLKSSFLPVRVDGYINRYDLFYHQLFFENPQEVYQFETRIMELSKRMKVDFFTYRSEIFYYIYTMVREIRQHKKYKIGVYSDLGREHALSLKLSCEKHFPMHSFELYKKNAEYKVVISTVSKIDGKKVVTVSDYINSSDIYNIYRGIYDNKAMSEKWAL